MSRKTNSHDASQGNIVRSLSGKWVDIGRSVRGKCEDPMLFCPSSWEEYRDKEWEAKPPCQPAFIGYLEAAQEENERVAAMRDFMRSYSERERGHTFGTMARNGAAARGAEMLESEIEAKAAGISAKMRLVLFGEPLFAKARNPNRAKR